MKVDPLLFAGVSNCHRCVLNELRGDPLDDEEVGRSQFAVPGEVGPRYRKHGIAVMVPAPSQRDGRLGRSSQDKVLEQLLEAAGIDLGACLRVRRVRCQPPNNRLGDYPDAVFQCDMWSAQELRVYDPAVVIMMGNDALRLVFGEKAYVTYTRGQVRSTSNDHGLGARLWVATFHPNAIAHQGGVAGETGRLVVSDLTTARELWQYGDEGS